MSHAISYNQCLEAMFSLHRFGIKLGLDTIGNILDGLGRPQDDFAGIHIAGTNGKGSVASMLATLLTNAGYRVGLYTSPHLVRFNERIRINGRMISDADVVESFEAVKQVHFGDREPTFFEYTTAMAFYEFSRKHVDWAIIETGMGGRLDATNVLNPEVSIITNVSLEHQMYLGHTLASIAFEKGGIIKPGVSVVTGVKQASAMDVITRIALEKSADLYRFKTEFKVRKNRTAGFTYFGMQHTWRDLHTGLSGSHQTDNAALALAACELLMDGTGRRPALSIDASAIRRGLEQNVWPGRLETVSTSPLVIIDGAHNLAAVRNLTRFLSERINGRRLTCVVGILDDKSYQTMLRHLLSGCSRVILTRPKIDRSLAPEKLYAVAKRLVDDVRIIPDVPEAVNDAIQNAGTDDAVCIAGSLYLAGEVMAAIENGQVKI